MSKKPTRKSRKNKWQIYTEEKRKLEALPLTNSQYEKKIFELAKRLGV